MPAVDSDWGRFHALFRLRTQSLRVFRCGYDPPETERGAAAFAAAPRRIRAGSSPLPVDAGGESASGSHPHRQFLVRGQHLRPHHVVAGGAVGISAVAEALDLPAVTLEEREVEHHFARIPVRQRPDIPCVARLPGDGDPFAEFPSRASVRSQTVGTEAMKPKHSGSLR